MYSLNFSNKDGKLTFESTHYEGRMVDITDEPRSKAISKKKLIKGKTPVYKSLYICRHPVIIPMAKLEDKSVDAVYIRGKKMHVIVVDSECEVKWNGEVLDI